MGALVGLLAGLGGLLIWRSLAGPRSRAPAATRSLHDRVAELLSQAGYPGLPPSRLYALSALAGGVVGGAAAAVSRAASVAVAFGLLAAWGPVALVRARRRARSVELRAVWPDVVDNLVSGIRAGLSLPEALAAVGVRGPDPLRPAFAAFGEDFRVTGRFGDSLDRLKATLADPVADRIVEALRMAREVGGTDLGRLLRTLGAFIREDARTRSELETRQGWTVSAARLAVAAPWVMLGLLSLRPQGVAAYDTAAGTLVLATGGAVSLGAYRLMIRIARLPEDRRVLR
ncbi:MAG TPA: type II secretion system F family protein [Mycobacteriales bacterium]|nr:type II secretion system F family protein [Mycobacteriales bacterium]